MQVCRTFSLVVEGLFFNSRLNFYIEPAKLDTPAAQPEEDPRFEITIISPQNETAQFKTRGKHPVRKVLAAACKTFDIKYERYVLVILIPIYTFFFIFHI